MKKYRICLFLFLGVSVICILIAFFVRRSQEGAGLENRNETGIEQLETEETQETVVEDQMAANQERVQAHPVQEEYYLVAEDGMLLICKGSENVSLSLYTYRSWIFHQRSGQSCGKGSGFRLWQKCFIIWNRILADML